MSMKWVKSKKNSKGYYFDVISFSLLGIFTMSGALLCVLGYGRVD